MSPCLAGPMTSGGIPAYYAFVIFQPGGKVTKGIPPVGDNCPICGTPEIVNMYGLAFGGMGEYFMCDVNDCPWFYKVLDQMEDQ